jgi:hypothetical protein
MCFSFNTPSPPPPPPLAPPPPTPEPPTAPLPEAAPVETDINPKVREAKSKKARSQDAKGTSALRIDLAPEVNTGATGPSGGLNK